MSSTSWLRTTKAPRSIDDLPGYRTLIISGSTVSYLAVYLRLSAGDIVEVIDFEIDTDTGTDQPDN